jgi:acetyltransferase-like isoleucine patch superfamily enzyme
VENESFIGSNSVLLNGTKIGFSVVIGVGSVVTTYIPDIGIYAGNSCHKIS